MALYGRLTTPKRLYVNEGEHAGAEYLSGSVIHNGVWIRVKEWLDLYVKKRIGASPARVLLRHYLGAPEKGDDLCSAISAKSSRALACTAGSR